MTVRLDLDALDAEEDAYTEACLVTPEIDTFCTSLDWVIPAQRAFHPAFEPFVYRLDSGFLCLSRGTSPSLGRYLAPLEAMWGLASPVVGPDVVGVAVETVRQLEAISDEWDTVWLCGLDESSPLFRTFVNAFAPRYRMGLGPRTRRYEASLIGGYDGFLGRRSRKFRKALRRAERRAQDTALRFELHDTASGERDGVDLYARIIAIERQSWKGRAEVGIQSGAMHAFYAEMVARLAARGSLSVCFATYDGEDIGYLFGGSQGDLFRGLQMSFSDAYEHLSVGNLMQTWIIRRLVAQGITRYDLGSALEYKSRWAEGGRETVALAIMKA